MNDLFEFDPTSWFRFRDSDWDQFPFATCFVRSTSDFQQNEDQDLRKMGLVETLLAYSGMDRFVLDMAAWLFSDAESFDRLLKSQNVNTLEWSLLRMQNDLIRKKYSQVLQTSLDSWESHEFMIRALFFQGAAAWAISDLGHLHKIVKKLAEHRARMAE